MVALPHQPGILTLIRRVSALLFAIFLAASGVHASDARLLAVVDGWRIVTEPAGGGCLASKAFDDGATLRIRFDPASGAGVIHAVKRDWGPLIEGDPYAIIYDLDGTVAEAEGMGHYYGQQPGMALSLPTADFLTRLASTQTLRFYFGEAEVMAVDLTGSATALRVAQDCRL